MTGDLKLTKKQQRLLSWLAAQNRTVTVQEVMQAGFGGNMLGILSNKGLVEDLGFKPGLGQRYRALRSAK